MPADIQAFLLWQMGKLQTEGLRPDVEGRKAFHACRRPEGDFTPEG